MRKRVIVISLIAFCLNCTPYFISRKSRTQEKPAGTESEQKSTVRTEPQKNVQLTFIDTLNRGKEIRLAGTDFKSTFNQAPQDQSPATLKYRIQLFASSQIEALREQKKVAEEKTNLPVFIAYEAPYYKLFAGDFIQKTEAESNLRKLKKIGYNDAWIVSSKGTPAN